MHSRGEPGGPGRIVRRRMVLGGRVEGYSGEELISDKSWKPEVWEGREGL